jgi:alpha-methylacyl-CoA racemase
MLAFGIVCALVERQRSGKGQVVDAAMVDGAAVLMTMMHGFRHSGFWSDERGTNLIDTGAHFYDVYETKDGQYVSIGSIEPQFYAELLEKTGLAGEELPRQMDRSQWPAMKQRMEALFKQKTRDEWCRIMEGSDVCFAPVLSMGEAYDHPHNVARGTFPEAFGTRQPGPAPRFSRTRPEIQGPPAHPGQHTDEALADWGFSSEEITKLRDTNAVK